MKNFILGVIYLSPTIAFAAMGLYMLINGDDEIIIWIPVFGCVALINLLGVWILKWLEVPMTDKLLKIIERVTLFSFILFIAAAVLGFIVMLGISG